MFNKGLEIFINKDLSVLYSKNTDKLNFLNIKNLWQKTVDEQKKESLLIR
jgi:hypothetical protein